MRPARGQAPRRRPVEEPLRAGPDLVDVHPARAADHRLDLREVRQPPPGPRRQPGRLPRRARLRRDRRAVRSPLPGASRPRRSPACTPTSPATRRWPGAWWPPGSWPSCPCSSARTRSRPASDILHELSKHKNFGVRTLQAEDEIAGIGAALGASYGGHLGVTTTSGPGVALKSETIGLAISLELPLLIIDIQRGGPSTGLPTKTEQSDLLLAMYGHHGESPLPIVAPYSPSNCFDAAHRGGPHRADLPHAGAAAVRRLPGQRLRALAAAQGRRPRAHRGHLRHRAQPRRRGRRARVLALPARSRDPRPAHRPAGHAGADAPHRRHREGRRQRQHQLRPGQPRAHGRSAGGQDRRDRQRPAARRGHRRRRRRRRAPRGGLGLDVGRHQRRGRPCPRTGAAGGPDPPRPPQPVPAQPGRGARPLSRRCSSPR